MSFGIDSLSCATSPPQSKRGCEETLEAERTEGDRSTVNSNHVTWKRPCDANPAIVDFFLSPETDADISINSFSFFRLLVKSLLVARQQQK